MSAGTPGNPEALAMVHHVHLAYRRVLDHPVDQAFAWLTDFDDRDAERAGAIIAERTVESRQGDTIVLRGALEAFGARREGHAEVELDPPAHWHATLYDARGRPADVFDYRLLPRNGGRGSLLAVDYGFLAPKLKHRVRFWLLRPLIRREIDKMWDGFVAAMDEELAHQV